jgi:hypothetical protein
MKLFRSRTDEAQPREVSFQLALPSQQRTRPIILAPISLSAEQRRILETPVDSRVDRILHEIEQDKIATEQIVNSRRIVRFPHEDTGERKVVKDESGYWRIIPGEVPNRPDELSDAL